MAGQERSFLSRQVLECIVRSDTLTLVPVCKKAGTQINYKWMKEKRRKDVLNKCTQGAKVLDLLFVFPSST